jgi:DNA-binding LacI/PurR family transcriptional regulator
MTSPRQMSSRSSTKLDLIAEELRAKIIHGDYLPGASLPTRTELEAHFQVSRVTIQRALDRLMEDGFVVAKPGAGTYVAERPPHLYRYGVVFPYRSTEEKRWMPFWTILRDAALSPNESLGEKRERRIAVFYSSRGRVDSMDYLELEHDVESHTLAGLLFVSNPVELLDAVPLTEPGIPRVVITDAEVPDTVAVKVRLDAQSFLDKALDFLAQRGRRRIALLTEASAGVENPFCTYFVNGVAKRQMESSPRWIQAIRSADAAWARNLTHLLMQAPPADRPDGLVIAHDGLVEHAKAGLIAAEARVPDEVDVLAHCNFPALFPAVLPIKRLGYDVRQVLRVCLECIDRLRAGETLPKTVKIPAMFEEESRTPQPDGAPTVQP